MKSLAKNKTVIRFAKKMLYIKKHQPALYSLISFVTDGMVLGIWMVLSVGIALLMVNKGFATFDSAMMGLCLVDLNVLIFYTVTDTEYYEVEDEDNKERG